MRLLYFADIRFPMERANGIQTAETAHALARRGIEVELMVRRSDDRSDEACLEFYGLPPHEKLRLHRVPTRFGSWSYRKSALSSLLHARSEPAVAYTRDLLVADLAIRSRSLHGMPVVYEAHTVSAIFAEERGEMYESEDAASGVKLARLDARERRVCQRASGVVGITRALLQALEERHGGLTRSAVIPDGCRVPDELPEASESSPPQVYYIGQLYPWKGVDVLIEAVRSVPRAELVVVGGLPPETDLDRLKRLVSDLAFEDRVRFRGFIPPAELDVERRKADLFVIPLLDSTTARLFTSPLKLFEAMASGRPIVASDLPSIREVLTHERNALLVPAGDAGALASAIERLLRERELARALAARAFEDVKAYSWDRRAEAIEAFVREVTPKAPAGSGSSAR
jgi:glycosyltransferase involved in cell wall biosynthesis